jgi:hypothetical protein
MSKPHLLCVTIATLFVTGAAGATEYHFCISSDIRPANLIVKSGTIDFGREWYRVSAARDFCEANNASGCTSNDYSARVCGQLKPETLEYYSADGKEITALFSGDPIRTGQALVEIYTGVTVDAAKGTFKVVSKGAKKVCRLVAKHC